MAVGSGLGSSWGFVSESTYGTYVAPTKFIPVLSATVSRESNRVQGMGLKAGSDGPLASHYAEATSAGSGTVSFNPPSRGWGQLLQVLAGGTSTCVQQAATAAYLQTHTLTGDTLGKSLTIQKGVPYRAGTVRPHTITGAKVTGAEFSCDANGGPVSASFTFDAKTWTDAQTLAAVSYPADTQPPFHGGQLTVKVGAYASEASVAGVRSYSLSISRPHDTEDYTAGASGLKGEPVRNGYTSITGSLTADWMDKTVFQDRAHAASTTSLVIEHVGALIASTYYYTLRFTVPGVKFEQSTQNVDGVGELTNSWNWEWAYDGTNAPKIELMSIDTTI